MSTNGFFGFSEMITAMKVFAAWGDLGNGIETGPELIGRLVTCLTTDLRQVLAADIGVDIAGVVHFPAFDAVPE